MNSERVGVAGDLQGEKEAEGSRREGRLHGRVFAIKKQITMSERSLSPQNPATISKRTQYDVNDNGLKECSDRGIGRASQVASPSQLCLRGRRWQVERLR